ncbi:MAG TPA: hypothetical protein VNB49_05690, partial [Candidatus Dormibacteraeota bacterium]|nr:hypothetical protein [Candidatus Dormibacteraeota bacterium]
MKICFNKLMPLLVCSTVFLPVMAQQPSSSRPPQNSKGESVYSEITKAPEKARLKRNPLEKDPEAAAAGR